MKQKFSERLKELRSQAHLSQKQLADKIGSSPRIICYWELGSSEPTASFIVALANCFGVSTDYLLCLED